MIKRILGLVSLLLFISFPLHASNPDCQSHQCMAVVDAGSSGSRLHIYAYDLDKTGSPININELWNKKIKPGFASIDANQDTVNHYLAALLSDAPQKNIPLYFFSTAGMRLLSKPKQKQLFGFLETWFNNSGEWQLKRSKTITGKEEGVYGWLAVNYQLGTLTGNNTDTSGVMDMGGASVQISFKIDREDGIAQEDIQEINIYGHQLKLFTHSFLGLGQNEISHQFLDKSSCFSNEYELPGGESAAGDAYSCKAEVASLLNNVHKVAERVQPIVQTNPLGNWYVLGGMAELAKTEPFQFNNYQFDNQTLIEKANTDLCHQAWPFLSQQYPDNDYLYNYCFFSSYYYALMVDGYGLRPEQAVNYMQSDKGSDWTIGVILLNSQIS